MCDGLIYLATAKEYEAVKIGFTTNLDARLRQLNYQPTKLPAPFGFYFINFFMAYEKDEHELHSIYADRRIRGEWFFFCKDWKRRVDRIFFIDELRSLSCDCWVCLDFKSENGR